MTGFFTVAKLNRGEREEKHIWLINKLYLILPSAVESGADSAETDTLSTSSLMDGLHPYSLFSSLNDHSKHFYNTSQIHTHIHAVPLYIVFIAAVKDSLFCPRNFEMWTGGARNWTSDPYDPKASFHWTKPPVAHCNIWLLSAIGMDSIALYSLSSLFWQFSRAVSVFSQLYDVHCTSGGVHTH